MKLLIFQLFLDSEWSYNILSQNLYNIMFLIKIKLMLQVTSMVSAVTKPKKKKCCFHLAPFLESQIYNKNN